MKSNYQPINAIPNLSKIFENILYDQISSFLKNIFSKYQTGFQNSFNPQNCLVTMIEKLKKSLDQKDEYAALLRDLSKAFEKDMFKIYVLHDRYYRYCKLCC